MTRSLRWGIIGLGRFGMVHARVLRSMRDVELAMVCGRSPERMQAAAVELGNVAAVTDYRRLLDDPSIDAVTIATHWREHFDVALAALQSGKHVLLEKPMAATGDECRRLVAAARSAKGFLMVGHVCRFDPRVTLARQAILEGRLGRIVSMHARRNLRRAAGFLRLDKISPLMGDGIHDADLMLWFTGRMPSRVYGRNVRVDDFEHPDLGWALLEFGGAADANSAIGVVETVWRLPANSPYQIDARMEVIGTDGALYIDCAEAGLTIHDARGASLPDTAYWPEQHGTIIGALAAEIRYFADCVHTATPPTVTTPADAASAVLVMEAAERSALSGLPEVVESL